SSTALFAQSTDPAPYCNAGYSDFGGMAIHYISNVTLGTLNNTSGTTSYAFPHYVYYNNVQAPGLTTGSTYSLSVMHDPDSIDGYQNTMHWIAVYIDYNHDNDFDDAGELVLSQILGDTAHKLTNPSTANITIPENATSGITRMRVIINEDDGVWAPQPCAN